MGHPAIRHEGDPVGIGEDAIIMRDDDRRAVGPQRNLTQQLHHPAPGFSVERRRGLIADQQARFMDQRAGNGDTLLLPAGKRGWQLAEMASEAKPFQPLAGPLPRLAGETP